MKKNKYPLIFRIISFPVWILFGAIMALLFVLSEKSISEALIKTGENFKRND